MRILFLFFWLCIQNQNAFAQASLGLVNLDSVKVETDDHASLVDIKLSAKPDWNRIELEDHGSFLQLSLPNVSVSKPGEFIQGKGPIFPKIGLLQPKPDLSSVRLFANTEAAKIKNNSTVDVLENRIIVRTEHKGILDPAKETAIQEAADENKNKNESYMDAFKKIKSDLGVASNNDNPNENLIKESKTSESMDDLLQEKLKIAAVVSALLFGVLLLVRYVAPRFRRYKNKHSAIQFSEKESKAIELLSSTSLNAKNKLQVIKIGNQSFLLNIGLEQVQLLTELDSGNKRLVESSSISSTNKAIQEKESIRIKSSQTTMALPSVKENIDTKKTLPRVIHGATSSSGDSSINSQEQALERVKTIAQNIKTQSAKANSMSAKKQVNPTSRNRINVAIGDEGVIQASSSKVSNSNEAAKDVTRLIREKLAKLRDIET